MRDIVPFTVAFLAFVLHCLFLFLT